MTMSLALLPAPAEVEAVVAHELAHIVTATSSSRRPSW